jgi:hypothetical protein
MPRNIFLNEQLTVIADPIDPARVSKKPTSCLNASSVVKAILVFGSTIGLYNLFKNKNIFSYFGLSRNSKDVSSEITKVESRENSLGVRRSPKTASQANNPFLNRISKTYRNKDSNVKFKEIKVEEFKDLMEVKKENMEERRSIGRRSISVQNPISDQNATVGELFELTINGTEVFSSDSALFLEATNIPTWLIFSNPNPTFEGSYDTPELALEVAISGNYAYVADYRSGLQIIDISDHSNPTFKGSYDTPDYAIRVAISSIYAYVSAGSLQIIDISAPSNPTFKGSYDTGGAVAVSSNYAYVADGGSGLQIIDVKNPENPILKGSYDTPDHAYGVAISGNYAYVADWNSGLQIIDISDPSNPTFKGSYDTLYAFRVAVSGNYAYVACGENYSSGFFKIIDVTNPENPTFKGSYETPDQAQGVAVSSNYAYVAVKNSGLQIIVLNLDKLTLSGTPNSAGTDEVVIKACNEAKECVTDSFDIMVNIDDTIDTTDTIDDTTTVIIIGSMSAAVCIACVTAFCLPLIIGTGILYRNKILKNENKISAREQYKQKDCQKPKATIPKENKCKRTV